MKSFSIFLLPLLFIAVITGNDVQNVNVVPLKNIEDNVKPITTTIPPPPPTTKTTTTTTTTPTPPTTKPTTPTTTTAKPTTTTGAPITTIKPTPAPTPSKPEIGLWNVTKPGSNETCIMAKMSIQLEITYAVNNVSKTSLINVPSKAIANGTCNKNNQLLMLKWNTSLVDIDEISFSFIKNETTSNVKLDSMGVTLNSLNITNVTEPLKFLHNHTEFNTPLKYSYKCDKEQKCNLINTQSKLNITASIILSNVQIQAFKNGTNEFDNAIDCVSTTPDIVPIAVGCALAVLVIMVLLAYLYGRRRSQARGYLSM